MIYILYEEWSHPCWDTSGVDFIRAYSTQEKAEEVADRLNGEIDLLRREGKLPGPFSISRAPGWVSVEEVALEEGE